MLDRWAQFQFNHVEGALLCLFAFLITATTVVTVLTRAKPEKDFRELNLRIRSWWVIILLFSTALLGPRSVGISFLAFVAFLALKEFFSLVPTRRADRRVLFWAYLAIPFQGWLIYIEWYGLFIIFIPIYVFLALPFKMLIIGETRAFLKSLATIHWGLMTCVYSMGHVAYLLVLAEERNLPGTGPGLLLFLVAFTQLNDVAQFIWGKMLGRHKISPKVSPNKTYEGFIGGVCTTTALCVLAAPYLTPFSTLHAVYAGLILSMGGFIGDLTISAVKRDLGVKDSGAILPGHGGILDRIDSLCYTAPLFFHFTRWFYPGGG